MEHFTHSESIGEIAKALSLFQADAPSVYKSGKGGGGKFTYKYATLDSIIDGIKELLAKHGLSISQHPVGSSGLVTILAHSETGQFYQSYMEMAADTSRQAGPQAHGSIITYMRRYSMSAILGLSTNEDDDANSAKPHLSEEDLAKLLKGIVDNPAKAPAWVDNTYRKHYVTESQSKRIDKAMESIMN